MKKLKTMGYVIIICSVCAVIFATIKDIPIEKRGNCVRRSNSAVLSIYGANFT